MATKRKVQRAAYVRFEEPPEKSERLRTSPKYPYWVPIVNKLRSRPTEWAIIATATDKNNAYQTAYGINHGKVPNFTAGQFEATYRFVRGEHRVYARYLGESVSVPAMTAEDFERLSADIPNVYA